MILYIYFLISQLGGSYFKIIKIFSFSCMNKRIISLYKYFSLFCDKLFLYKQTSENIGNLVSSVDGILSVVAKNRIVGQEPTEGKNDIFGFKVNKFRSDDLGNQNLSGFKMPQNMKLNGTGDGGVGTVVYTLYILIRKNQSFVFKKLYAYS